MSITVAAARINAGMTQQQAAEALKISKGTYCNYENGKTEPTIFMAEKIANLFGMTLDQITFRKK